MKKLVKKSKILFGCCFMLMLSGGIDIYADDNIADENGMEAGMVYDGLNYYDSISEALAQNDSSEISLTLLKNDRIDTSFTIEENKSVTIDLNGNNLDIGTTKGIGITNHGNLVIENSSEEGKISSYGSESTNANSMSAAARIQTTCIDNYSVVTLRNVQISSDAYISAYGSGYLEYKFLYNHENSTANIDDVTITGKHNVGSQSTYQVISIDDFFIYSESSCVNINGMNYSITSKTTTDKLGGNVIYQSGGSMDCNNLNVTSMFIDKGMYICDNADVEIVNSTIYASNFGLEIKSGSTVILNDSEVSTDKCGVKNEASSVKINRSSISVHGTASTVEGITCSKGGNLEIGKDSDNTVDNMCISVLGSGSSFAYGIISASELHIPRAYIEVKGARTNTGIVHGSSQDLVIGNTTDQNDDTVQIVVGYPSSMSFSACIDSNAALTKILSGLIYCNNSSSYAVISKDLMIGDLNNSPDLGDPIIYSTTHITAVNASNSEVYYYSGLVADGILAETITLPDHYSRYFDYDTDGKQYSYLDVERHNLIIHANGGETSVDSVEIPYDHYIEEYLDSVELSREGYTFTGWTLDEAGEADISFVKMNETDIDIYAQWKKDQKEENSESESNMDGSDVQNNSVRIHSIVQNHLLKCKVRVTSTDAQNRTVTYMGSTDLNAKSVVIPDEIIIDKEKYKVTEIADSAFRNNKRITKVFIGINMKRIGKRAFQGCIKLKNITIKSIHLTSKTIGVNAFKNIHKKAAAKVPKKKLGMYKKALKKRGINGKQQKIKKL